MSKNWGWKKTGPRKDKTFACSDNLGTKWSNPVKLDRKRRVWCLLLRVFNCYSQSLSS